MSNFDTLKRALHNGEVNISYTREDGTKRVVRATLKEEWIGVVDSKPQTHIVTVWDVDQQAWRSLRKDRIGKWEKIESQ